MKHNLVRDACDAGKVRAVYARMEDQQADLFSKPLETQKFFKHAKTILYAVQCDSNVGAYCERCKLSNEKYDFL